jgi:hypothetical protein
MSEETVQAEVVETPAAEPTKPEGTVPPVVESKPADAEKTDKPEAEKPEEKVKAKQFAYIQKQERKLQEARQALNAEVEQHRGQIEAARDELRSVYQRIQAEKSEFEKDRSKYETLVSSARENPVQWLKEHAGITPEEYFARVQGDGKPSPEFMLKSETERLSKTLDEKLSPLQKELEEHREFRRQLDEQRKAWEEHQEKQRLAQQEQQEQEQQAAYAQEARDNFLSVLHGNKDAYKDLLMYKEEEILYTAGELVRSLGDKAAQLTVKDIADDLQRSAADTHARIRGGQVQKATDPKAVEAAKTDTQLDANDPVAAAAAARNSRLKSVPKGQVRTAHTLNGDMSGRSTVNTAPETRDERIAKVIREIDAR